MDSATLVLPPCTFAQSRNAVWLDQADPRARAIAMLRSRFAPTYIPTQPTQAAPQAPALRARSRLAELVLFSAIFFLVGMSAAAAFI